MLLLSGVYIIVRCFRERYEMRKERAKSKSSDPGGEEKVWYKVSIPVKNGDYHFRNTKYVWACDVFQAMKRLNLRLSNEFKFLPHFKPITGEEKVALEKQINESEISLTRAQKYGFTPKKHF